MCDNILEIMKNLSTQKTKDFSTKLIKTKNDILGMKADDMRMLAKRIVACEFGDALTIIDNLPDNIYESLFVKGLVISKVKMPFEQRKLIVHKFIQKLDNWSNVDSFMASMKVVKQNYHGWFDIFCKYSKSDDEFISRVGVVGLMDYYLTNDYIDQTLECLVTVTLDKYYSQMAVSWAIATALAKYYDKTILIIENKMLPVWTHNRAIQKALESFRITDDKKAYLKTLKIKQ